MQINLCFPEKITAAEAETLASQLAVPCACYGRQAYYKIQKQGGLPAAFSA